MDNDQQMADLLGRLAALVEKIQTTDPQSAMLSCNITNTGLLAAILDHLVAIRKEITHG